MSEIASDAMSGMPSSDGAPPALSKGLLPCLFGKQLPTLDPVASMLCFTLLRLRANFLSEEVKATLSGTNVVGCYLHPFREQAFQAEETSWSVINVFLPV